MAPLTPAAHAGGPYIVPPEPSRTPAILLALAVHAGLLLFLWAGISWQNVAPTTTEAEVWDMKVQQAGPSARDDPPPPPPRVVKPVPPPKPVEKAVEKAVEKPPAVKPPDIALEREKKLKEQKLKQEQRLAEEKRDLEKARKELAEQKKRDEKKLDEQKKLAEQKKLDQKKHEQEKAEQDKLADKAEKLAQEKAAKAEKAAKDKKLAEEKKKLDQLHDAEMRRITGGPGGPGDSEHKSGPKGDPSYYGAIGAKIKSNLNYTGSTSMAGDPEAIYQIEQWPTGEIKSVKKIKSSGVPAYDQAVENAIAKSSPLPRKKDGTVDRSVPAAFKLKETQKNHD
ncbi:cell envelope integrity protein TolA [Massilia antarctica]|uniref:Cell envelope integrity protein TolA n=1 Tax=Massilia antarctica TaxID=2765360 RepID=A0AA49A7P4_9BURK|nr:cell envelope integrity protein TolA [Massilia antarctica]QPI49638.1 cell envelope integrity protein TolA [Massilia antarctica]